MGTPDFAVESLKMLVEHEFNIVGVVTAPDKPAGRGQQLQESAVKKYAVSKQLPVLQPANLKADDFQQQLQELHPNLGIVVAFRMLPESVWAFPELGTFNLHASLLPQYRGAAPINWAIINGETETGVTTFFLQHQIDTGDIIDQEKVSIGPDETAGELHDKLMAAGAKLVLKTVRQIEQENVTTKPQQENQPLKEAFKIFKPFCRIDWNRSLQEIHNHIRGLSPYPTAFTEFIPKNGGDPVSCKIFRSEMMPAEHSHISGTLVCTKDKLKVAVQGGYLHILELQLAGKKRMEAAALLNGFDFNHYTLV